MPRALVTGATGLLGWHIVRRLHELGWETRALVRREPAPIREEFPDIALVRADILDAEAFIRAAAGCDVIFHCAAVILRGGWEAFRRTNVEGTRNAIEAARASGARLFHASSVSVYGSSGRYRADGKPTAEDTPLAPLAPHAHYARSKRESEQLVLDAHRRGVIWATAIRPTVLYGAHDRQFVPRVELALRFPIIPVVGAGSNALSVVHAGNVADAAVLAATTEAAGGRAFNTANDFDVGYARFLALASRGLGRPIRLMGVPRVLVRSASFLIDRMESMGAGGRFHQPARYALDFLYRDNPFTSELARSELGWEPRGLPEVTIPEAFEWWKRALKVRRGRN